MAKVAVFRRERSNNIPVSNQEGGDLLKIGDKVLGDLTVYKILTTEYATSLGVDQAVLVH